MENFWKNVIKTGPLFGLTPCWVWIGCTTRRGYGMVGMDGKQFLVHRLSYEIHNGKIPEGLEIDHICRVRNCVNPKHLEAVTHAENVKRSMDNADKPVPNTRHHYTVDRGRKMKAAKNLTNFTDRIADRPKTILVQADIDSQLHAKVKEKMERLKKTKVLTWKVLIEVALERFLEEN